MPEIYKRRSQNRPVNAAHAAFTGLFCIRRVYKGTRLGRPQRVFRRDEAQRLRAEGASWREIARKLALPMSTVIDACRSENPPRNLQKTNEKHALSLGQ